MFQVLRDAPPLQQHGAARHFRGMRREHRHDSYLAQSSQRVGRGNSRCPHAQQSSAKRSGQHRLFTVEFGRAPPPLAMIGFRQVGQLKINGERFGHAISVLHFQPRDPLARLRHELVFGGSCRGQNYRSRNCRGWDLLRLLRKPAIARAAGSTGGGVAPPPPANVRRPALPALFPATFPASARPGAEEFPWRRRRCPRRALPAGRIDRPRSTAARYLQVPCHIMKAVR